MSRALVAPTFTPATSHTIRGMLAALAFFVVAALPGGGRLPQWPSGSPDDPARALEEAERTLDRAEAAREAGEGDESHRELARAFEYLDPLPLGNGHEETAALLERAMRTAALWGIMERAVGACNRIIAHRESTLPEGHLEILEAKLYLASCMRQAGLDGARELVEQVLARYEEELDEDDPALLNARMELGCNLRLEGDSAGARVLFQGVVDACELYLPDEDSLYAWAAGNLASAMADAGENAAARVLFEDVLVRYEVLYPRDDPDIIRARQDVALISERLEDWDTARRAWEQVAESRERTLPKDHADTSWAWIRLGLALRRQGDTAAARDVLERAVDACVRSLPADHPTYLWAAGNLAAAMVEAGEESAARVLFEEVLAGHERIHPRDHPDVIKARTDVADVAERLEDWAAARRMWEEVAASRTRTLSEVHVDTLSARIKVGLVLRAKGDSAEAQEVLADAVQRCARSLGVDHPTYLWGAGNLAAATAEEHDYTESRALFEEALAGYESLYGDDHPDVVRARADVAGIAQTLGEYSTARRLWEEVATSRERTLTRNHPDTIEAWLRVVANLRALGLLAQARAIAETLVEESAEALPEDHALVSGTRIHLASTLMFSGDLSGARAMFEEMLEWNARVRPFDREQKQTIKLFLSRVLGQLGDRPGQRALMESIVEEQERTLEPGHEHLLLTYSSYASVLQNLGELEEARRLREYVLEVLESRFEGDHPRVVVQRHNLAGTLSEQGEYDAAQALWESCLEIRERTLPANHDLLLGTKEVLAGCLWRKGDVERARVLFEEALEVRVRDWPARHPSVGRARRGAMISAHAMGDLDAASAHARETAHDLLERLEEAASLSPREARMLAGYASYDLPEILLIMEPRPPSEAPLRFELTETIRAVSNASLVMSSSSDVTRTEVQAIRERLGDRLSAGPRDGESRQAFSESIATLVRERDGLERKVREGPREGSVIRVADVGRALPPRSAAVGFVRDRNWVENEATTGLDWLGDVLDAHVVLPDGSLTELELGKADDLERGALAWRAGLGAPIAARGLGSAQPNADSIDIEQVADVLRKIVLDPILAVLPEGTTTLYICLEGFLHVMPLDALPLGEGFVGDRYRVVVQSSFADLLSERARPGGEPELLALGGPRFDAEAVATGLAAEERAAAIGTLRSSSAAMFLPLPETRVEAERVVALFSEEFDNEGVLLRGAEASKSAFRRLAPGKGFLHVATHGWFAPDEVRSSDPSPRSERTQFMDVSEAAVGFAPMTLCGLALTGANLGHDDLGRVPGIMTAEELAGLDLSSCELAVLSACETNVGLRRAGVGVQSLQSALHAAGARTAITSLWRVDDVQTRRLMELFYTALWRDGLSKADALWKAKTELRREGAALRDWAGWVLSGEPD